jgi:hypothetical protein
LNMSTLVIQLPNLPPVAHLLKDETITIGRMRGNTIVIEDSSISLVHAKITRRDGQFHLKDLNSTNGTMLNGQPITEARLQNLDKMRFAEVSAQFQAEEPVVAGQPARPPVAQPPQAPLPPKPRPAAPQPARAFNSGRLVAGVVTIFGGVVALGVVGFLGWRFFHVNSESSGKTASALLGTQQVSARQPSTPYPEPDSSQAPGLAESGQESVSQLVKALQSPDPAERRRAAMALHNCGPEVKEATASLRAALKDSEPEVRIWAALTLVNEKCYDKNTIPILVEVLHFGNATLRQVACLSLGLIPYDESEKDTVVPALAETAGKDENDEVRKAAVSALNVIAPETLGKRANN